MKLEENIDTTVAWPGKMQEKVDKSKKVLINAGSGDGEEAGADIELNEPLEDDCQKDAGGGKKKGARKKRSLNWEEAERCLLLEVIKTKLPFVENRNVDTASIKAKRHAWLQITKQFNALNFRHRSLEQIQVQWRSMKNTAKREYQQKHPKEGALDGASLIEFMEELQKEPVTARSHRLGGIKKELINDEDEDTPLASLPNNTSDDTQEESISALPSPPQSGESQNDIRQTSPVPKKKTLSNDNKTESTAPLAVNSQQTSPVPKKKSVSNDDKPETTAPVAVGKAKRQRRQHSGRLDDDSNMAIEIAKSVSETANMTILTKSAAIPPDEDVFKRGLFDLMKRARLADMDYARREHEQKLRLEQVEQELKISLLRKQEELKLNNLREEHEARMRHRQLEHEARMHAYHINIVEKNKKTDNKIPETEDTEETHAV